MRVIICGGGTTTPEDFDETLAAALDALHARHRFTLVGLRTAPGEDVPGDMLADLWTLNRGIDRVVFPETAKRGAFADHDRNRLMLTLLRPALLVILSGGPDTTNLLHQAQALKIKVETLTGAPQGAKAQESAPQGEESAPEGENGQESAESAPGGGEAPPGGDAPPPPPAAEGRGRPSAPRPGRTTPQTKRRT